MNAPKSWLSLSVSVAVLVLAACSTNNNSTTGGSGGPGGSGDTGGSGATGGSNSGNPGSGPTGSNTGVAPPQDPIGGKGCSKTGNGDYASCSTSADCQCPLLCALDYTLGADDGGGSICTMPCSQDSQCPDIATHCDEHGLCTTNICEADGGSDETPFFGPCDASGTGDGTCEPVADLFPGHAGNIIGICFQAGTADPGGACDPTYPPFVEGSDGNTKRPAGKGLCPVGYACNGTDCQQLCDPVFVLASDNDGGGCADDLSCVVLGKETRFGGACQTVGDGGCTVGEGSGELGDCTVSSDCSCPYSCEVDFSSFLHSCERVCTDTATDCDAPFTTCQKSVLKPALHFCNYNFCAQTFFGDLFKPDGGGGFGSACNILGTGDGTCEIEYVFSPGGLVNSFGYCMPGTAAAGAACGAPASALPFASAPPYCAQGNVCVPFNSGPLCEPPCDPVPDGGSTGCKDGDGCFSWIPLPLPQVTGFCQACTVAGDTTNGCQNSAECCDGFCDFNADAGTGVCN